MVRTEIEKVRYELEKVCMKLELERDKIDSILNLEYENIYVGKWIDKRNKKGSNGYVISVYKDKKKKGIKTIVLTKYRDKEEIEKLLNKLVKLYRYYKLLNEYEKMNKEINEMIKSK